jgi:hypothetical protein
VVFSDFFPGTSSIEGLIKFYLNAHRVSFVRTAVLRQLLSMAGGFEVTPVIAVSGQVLNLAQKNPSYYSKLIPNTENLRMVSPFISRTTSNVTNGAPVFLVLILILLECSIVFRPPVDSRSIRM